MGAVKVLRNVVIAGAALWALFGILTVMNDSVGIDGQTKLNTIFWFIASAALMALIAMVLEALFGYTTRRD